MIRKLIDGFKLYRWGIFQIALNRLLPELFSYQAFRLYHFNLTGNNLAIPTKKMPFSIHKIQGRHDELFNKFRQKFPADEFLSRIKQENKSCYVVLKNEEIAGYAWVAGKELAIESINYLYPLKNDEIFIYACFVSKEFRGEGMYPAMLRKILRDYGKDKKYRIAYIGVLSYNRGSIRGIEKAGFKSCGRIRYVKWLNNEKRWGLEKPASVVSSQQPA